MLLTEMEPSRASLALADMGHQGGADLLTAMDPSKAAPLLAKLRQAASAADRDKARRGRPTG
jgi:flagellar motility protein MotE (MotC chaperone)